MPMKLRIKAIMYPIKEITGMSKTIGPNETTEEPIIRAHTNATIVTLSLMSTSSFNFSSLFSIL